MKKSLLFFMLCFCVDAITASTRPANPEVDKFDLTQSYNRPSGLANTALLNLRSSGQEINPALEGIQFTSLHAFGSSKTVQIGRIVTDAQGFQYVTGGFEGTLILGTDTLVSTSGFDFYLAKFDRDNTPLWGRMAHGISLENENLSLDGGVTLVMDAEGDLYVGGGFVKSITFLDESGSAVAQLTDGRDDDLLNLELFVAKYDAEGNLLWALGGESGSEGSENSLAVGINSVNDIVLDTDGYPYIVGRFSGTTFMGLDVSIVGNSDAYIASLDKDGSELFWVSTTGTPGDDVASSASVDHLGYINVLGTIGEGVMQLPESDISWDNDSGEDDTFIISYDVNGEWYFASFLGAGERVVGNDIATSPNGDFFVTGFFQDAATFAGSDIELNMIGSIGDGFIAKYDIDGDAVWAVQFWGQTTEGQRIILDDEDNVYVLGIYYGFVVFGDGPDNQVVLSTDSFNEMFIAKYDTDGNFLWAKKMQGNGQESVPAAFLNTPDFPFSVIPLDIQFSQSSENQLLITGDFNNSLRLDALEVTSTDNTKRGFIASLDVGGSTVNADPDVLPTTQDQVSLLQNYPNPFTTHTSISFALPTTEEVTLEVFDVSGRRVQTLVNEVRSAGQHQVDLQGADLPAGVYFYRLQQRGQAVTKSFTVLR